jgi:hypothetical protein
MIFLNNFEPETLGFIFVFCIFCTLIFIGMLLKKALKRNPVENDLSDVLEGCDVFGDDEKPTPDPEPTMSVGYELKEYKLRFDNIEGLWVPFAIIGVHVSKIKDVRPNELLRGAMMDTFVALKVQTTNKVTS